MLVAWITGARGFIGRYLAHSLHSEGYRVAGIGHGTWPEAEAAHWGISFWLNGGISTINLDKMRHSLGLPDVIFHLAGGSSVSNAIVNPYEDFIRTVVSTLQLLEWIRQNSSTKRLVAVSSAAVYGTGHSGAIAEDAQLSPSSPYGAHKLMMEDLCRSYASHYGLQIVLPRLFSVYGPGLKKQILWDLCSKIASGGPVDLGGTGDELRDWTDVRDAVQWLMRIEPLASAQTPVINLATGIATSVREIATMVMTNWYGGGPQAKTVKFTGRSRVGDPFSLVANINQMHALGIGHMIPVAQGVAEYVAWYLTQTGCSP